MSMISARDLTKIYNAKVRAVDHVSFDVDAGEVIGFLGPNGAGKTTLVRILTTLTKPTEGTALVGGFDVVRQAGKVRRQVGIVPQDLSVDGDLTGMENLLLQARLYDVPKKEAKDRAKRLLELVDFTEYANRAVETYSGGMRKRLEILCGLISQPKILFLDEPTLGLDVRSRTTIWEYLKKLNEDEGLTLFINTNYMEEADALCDQIIILDRGKIVTSGTPDSLKTSLGGNFFELTVVAASSDALSLLESFESVTEVDRIDDSTYRARVNCSEDELLEILQRLKERGIRIVRLVSKRPGLDEVFLHYTGRKIRSEVAEEKQEQSLKRNITPRTRI